MELHPILDTETPPKPGWWYVLSTIGDSPSMRVGHTSTYIKGVGDEDAGKLYIIGGANPSTGFCDTYILNLNTLHWDTLDSPGLRARYEHVAFVPESQPTKIYIFGGADQAGNMNDIQCLDTVAHTWSQVVSGGTPPAPRTHHTTAVVQNKLIVYSGGQSGADPVGDRQVHCFDTTTSTWSVLPLHGDSPKPRHGHVMVAVGNRIFVHGGMAGSAFYDDLHILDLDKNSWMNVKRKKVYPSARAGHSGIACGSDFYIFGGMNRDGALDDMYKFETTTLTWSKIELQGPPPPSRLDFAMCVVDLQRRTTQNLDCIDVASTSRHAKEVLEQELKPGSASSQDSRQDAGSESSSIGTDLANAGAFMENNILSHSNGEGGDNSDAVEAVNHTTNLVATTYRVCLINGGMDTQGEIFDDTLVILLDQVK